MFRNIKIFSLLLTLWSLCGSSFAQHQECLMPTLPPDGPGGNFIFPTPGCVGNNQNGYCTYAPFVSAETPIRIVRITNHVLRCTDTSLPVDPNGQMWNVSDAFITEVFNRVNDLYGAVSLLDSDNTMPWFAANPSDTRIRFVIDNTQYHDFNNVNQWLFPCPFLGGCNGFFSNHINNTLFPQCVTNNNNLTADQKANTLHLFWGESVTPPFVFDSGTQYDANAGAADDMPSNRWIYMVNNYKDFLTHPLFNQNLTGNQFLVASMLAHEFGHALGLQHSDGGDGLNDTPPFVLNNDVMHSQFASARNSFTPCQIGKMQYFLATPAGAQNVTTTQTFTSHVVKDYCNINTINPADNIVITQNTTWNTLKYLKGNVTVNSGVKLEIQCTVHMPKGSTITVLRGGTLDLNGGTLTNDVDCGEIWQGIQVYGGGGIAAHGKVILRNNALIEHARIGIQLGYTPPGSPLPFTGGVLEATNSTFRNCLIGVSAEATNLATTLPASFINNCTFTWTNALRQPLQVRALTHVQAFSRRNFSINNSTFNNELTIPVGGLGANVTKRGVFCNTAAVLVQNNTFQNLNNGVEMLSAGYSASNVYNILDNTLTDCFTPITISGWYEDFFVQRNKINTNGSPNTSPNGIVAAGVSGADVRGNTIRNVTTGIIFKDCYYTPGSHNVYGINLLNNDIRNVAKGMQSTGTQGGYGNQISRFDCNTSQNYANEALSNDVYLTDMSDPPLPRIGNPQTGVKNFFLDDVPGASDISTNPDNDFIYYHAKPTGNAGSACFSGKIIPTVSDPNLINVVQNQNAVCNNGNALDCGNGVQTGRLAQLIQQLLQATTPKDRRRLVREIVQTYRDMGQSAAPFLQSLTDQTLQNDMIPMLIGQGKFTQAQNAINALPFGTPEELDVRDYFQILLDLGTQGKMIKEASPAAIARVKQIAFQNVKAVRFSARAFLNMAIDTLIEETPDNNFGGRFASETGGGLI